MNGCCNIAKWNGGAEYGQKARGNEAQLNGRNGVQFNKDVNYYNGAQLNGDAKGCNGTQMNEEADCCNGAQVIGDANRCNGAKFNEGAKRCKGAQVIGNANRCNGANFNEDAKRCNGAIVIGDAKRYNGAKFNEDAKRCNGDQVIGNDNRCNVAKFNADAKRCNGEQKNVDSSCFSGAQLNEDASFCSGAHLKGNAKCINGAQWDSNCCDVAQLNTDCGDKAQLNGDANNCNGANPNRVTNYRNGTLITQDIKLGTINGYCNSHDLNGQRSFLEAYVAPDWGAGLKGIPTHKVKLAQCDTPIQKWNLPGVPSDFEVFIKRDDLTGSVLSGNKVRHLEFMFAEAIQQGCTSVITYGFVNSNFLRAAAICARTLGMQIHILVKTDEVKDSDTMPCTGNALLYSMVGAHLYFIPRNSKEHEDILPRVQQLADKLREGGEKPYVMIPYKHPWVFGYVDCFNEMLKQGIAENITDIVCASAHGGTISGLVAGNHLTGNIFRIHGMVTEVASSGQHETINRVLREIDLQKPDGTGLKSEDACNYFDDALGEGYAVASPDLLGGVFSLFDGRMQPVFDAKHRDDQPRLWSQLTDSVPFIVPSKSSN